MMSPKPKKIPILKILVMDASEFISKVSTLTREAKSFLESFRDTVIKFQTDISGHLVEFSRLEEKLAKIAQNKEETSRQIDRVNRTLEFYREGLARLRQKRNEAETREKELRKRYEAGLRGEFPDSVLVWEPEEVPADDAKPAPGGNGAPASSVQDLNRKKEALLHQIARYFAGLEADIENEVREKRKYAIVEEEIGQKNRKEEDQYRILQKKFGLYSNELLDLHREIRERIQGNKGILADFEDLVFRLKKVAEAIPPGGPSEEMRKMENTSQIADFMSKTTPIRIDFPGGDPRPE